MSKMARPISAPVRDHEVSDRGYPVVPVPGPRFPVPALVVVENAPLLHSPVVEKDRLALKTVIVDHFEAMDYAYRFASSDRLYLNVTNRCTNRCSFCVRSHQAGLGDGRLWGGGEPELDDLLQAVDARGGAGAFSEVVWCGFGEPTFRLDLILEASPIFRTAGVQVRLDTNGHACLIHNRNVVPDLAAVIDEVSVSLNAATCERYVELCEPSGDDLGREIPPEVFWQAVLDFIRGSVGEFERVQASVVGHVLEFEEIEACRELADSLGCDRLRVR